MNVRQLEGEFVDSVHVHKSEGVQGRIAKSKMWWFENLNMSLTVIEVPSNEEALRPIRLLESRNQESGIVLKTFLNSCLASRKTCFPPLKARSSE